MDQTRNHGNDRNRPRPYPAAPRDPANDGGTATHPSGSRRAVVGTSSTSRHRTTATRCRSHHGAAAPRQPSRRPAFPVVSDRQHATASSLTAATSCRHPRCSATSGSSTNAPCRRTVSTVRGGHPGSDQPFCSSVRARSSTRTTPSVFGAAYVECPTTRYSPGLTSAGTSTCQVTENAAPAGTLLVSVGDDAWGRDRFVRPRTSTDHRSHSQRGRDTTQPHRPSRPEQQPRRITCHTPRHRTCPPNCRARRDTLHIVYPLFAADHAMHQV